MEVKCPNPECTEVLILSDDMTGKAVKCPECGGDIEVPAFSADAERKCPDCGATLGDDAVMCVQCGFNLQTGHKMVTESADPSAEGSEEEAAASPVKAFLADYFGGMLSFIVKLRYVWLVLAIVVLLLAMFNRWFQAEQKKTEPALDGIGEMVGKMAPLLEEK